MERTEAQQLIKGGVLTENPSRWADLGCGSGTFTYALASLLPQGSHIHAVDKRRQRLTNINTAVDISFEKADLNTVVLDQDLVGILMANALHYVKDKATLLERLRQYLKPEGRFIIVEYESRRANPWVPYPVEFNALAELCLSLGYSEVTKIAERPSLYGGTMYSSLILPS